LQENNSKEAKKIKFRGRIKYEQSGDYERWTGLMLAYLLKQRIHLVLEANSRIGGRINTITGASGVTIEMGATWFGKQHPTLLSLDSLGLLLDNIQISLFETMSFVPPQKFEIQMPRNRHIINWKLNINQQISEAKLGRKYNYQNDCNSS
jgi:protoporphyrinogen oxidase